MKILIAEIFSFLFKDKHGAHSLNIFKLNQVIANDVSLPNVFTFSPIPQVAIFMYEKIKSYL